MSGNRGRAHLSQAALPGRAAGAHSPFPLPVQKTATTSWPRFTASRRAHPKIALLRPRALPTSTQASCGPVQSVVQGRLFYLLVSSDLDPQAALRPPASVASQDTPLKAQLNSSISRRHGRTVSLGPPETCALSRWSPHILEHQTEQGMHVAAVGSTFRRLGSIGSPHLAQVPYVPLDIRFRAASI